MKNKELTTAMERYRNSIKPTKVDLKLNEREKLDKILNETNKSLVQWVREHIEEDYKKI